MAGVAAALAQEGAGSQLVAVLRSACGLLCLESVGPLSKADFL